MADCNLKTLSSEMACQQLLVNQSHSVNKTKSTFKISLSTDFKTTGLSNRLIWANSKFWLLAYIIFDVHSPASFLGTPDQLNKRNILSSHHIAATQWI